jgi:hypothetical protein
LLAEIDEMMRANPVPKAPANHPPINTRTQLIANKYGDERHGNFDGLIARGRGYEGEDHPPIDRYFPRLPTPSTEVSAVSAFHPDVDAAYARGGRISLAWHPSVSALLRRNNPTLLPTGHPDVDTLLADPAAHPLPAWHPKLGILVTPRPKPFLPVPTTHSNLDAAYRAGTPLPAAHPDVSRSFAALLPAGHPDVAPLLGNPAAAPLPAWHPALDGMVARIDYGNPAAAKVQVFAAHPSIDRAYAEGAPVPASHPGIARLFSAGALLPPTHPDVGALFADPTAKPLPAWHPTLENYVVRFGATGKTGGIDQVEVPAFHPDIDAAYKRGAAVPPSHPAVAPLLAALLPPSHPDVDMLLADPAAHPLPSWHPRLEDFVKHPGALSATDLASLAWDHPALDASYRRGIAVPDNHPSSQQILSELLPPSHPDIDVLLADPAAHPLPGWHPSLNRFVTHRSRWSPGLVLSIIVLILFELAIARRKWRRWQKKKMERQRAGAPPKDIELLPVTKDSGSPPVNKQQEKRMAPDGVAYTEAEFGAFYGEEAAAQWAAAAAAAAAAGQANAGWISQDNPGVPRQRRAWSSAYARPKDTPAPRNMTIRNAMKRFAAHRRADVAGDDAAPGGVTRAAHSASIARLDPSGEEARERGGSVFGLSRDDGSATSYSNPMLAGGGSSAGGGATTPLPESMVVVNPASATLGAEYENRNSKLKAAKSHAIHTRVKLPSLSLWKSGDVLFVLAWLGANALVLACFGIPQAGGGYDLGRSTGSLAAANAAFLVVPATRNSVLTWAAGLPFDHVILHHRFLGRVTIALSCVHGACYVRAWVKQPRSALYLYGFFAMLCGLVILATTTNWFRRRYFNVFFYAHYAFVGFFAFAYAHVRQARPFLLAGIAAYTLDKLVRSLMHFVPRRTLLFRNRGDGIAQVRFPKNPFAELAGVHRVGQYMFVNFPELSLLEWHPFSVSSGPREPFVELHIRALGDHTNKVVALAKQCAAEGRNPWIRSEGPYGHLDFDLRRYGMLMLVGGGVGITPVIGILKDLFLLPATEPPPPPCSSLQCVVVVWVLQQAKDAATFLDVLEQCTARARESTGGALPNIVLRVHCTRAKAADIEHPLYTGRPAFGSILDDAAAQHSVKSTLIFACGPTRMVESLWDMSSVRNSPSSRVDFHHETFEF